MKRTSSYFLAQSLKVTLFAASLSLFFSCGTNTSNTEIPIMNIEEGVQQGKTIPLSSICSSIEYIPLQTDSTALIGERPFFAEAGGFFYCADSQGKNCKVFDGKGNFIKTIGNKGNGKGEFIILSELAVDSHNSNVLIRDFNKIVVYDKDGAFVKDVSFDKIKNQNYSVTGMAYLGNGQYCLGLYRLNGDIAALAVINDEGDVLWKRDERAFDDVRVNDAVINGKSVQMRTTYSLVLQLFNDNIRVVNLKNDTIFTYSGNFERKPAFVKYLGKYKLNEDESNMAEAIKLTAHPMLETPGQLFFKFIFPLSRFSYSSPKDLLGYAIYNKVTGTVDALAYDPRFQTTGLQNDIDGGAPFWPSHIVGNKLYQFVSAMKFIEMSNASDSAQMKEIASKMTENSNPVLVVATIAVKNTY
jgi:6-bladed beta-propeller